MQVKLKLCGRPNALAHFLFIMYCITSIIKLHQRHCNIGYANTELGAGEGVALQAIIWEAEYFKDMAGPTSLAKYQHVKFYPLIKNVVMPNC